MRPVLFSLVADITRLRPGPNLRVRPDPVGDSAQVSHFLVLAFVV